MKSLFVVLVLLASPLYAQFYLGDSVSVKMGANGLNSHTLPLLSAPSLKVEPDGARGQVIGGPQSDPNYTFYQIKYNDGITGWSAAPYLVKIVPVAPPPVVTDTSKISIQLQGFKVVQVVGDSIIIVKKR